MIRVFRVFAAYLRAGIGVMLQYRGEILLWAVWGLVNPAVLYAMWSAAAESNPEATAAGLTRGQFAAYYFIIMIVGHFATAWDAYEVGYLIRTGRMSPLLLLPVPPIWKALADNAAYKVTTLLFVVPMWLVFAWLVSPEFETTAWQLAAGSAALVLGCLLNFLLGYVVALLAFWFTKLDALGEVYFGLGMFLGGRFAPLEALPPPIRWAADVLPFRWMFAFPTEMLMGRTGAATALVGLAVQGAWIAATAAVLRWTWSAAVKRYTAVGG